MSAKSSQVYKFKDFPLLQKFKGLQCLENGILEIKGFQRLLQTQDSST